jgi:hypothetical protein
MSRRIGQRRHRDIGKMRYLPRWRAGAHIRRGMTGGSARSLPPFGQAVLTDATDPTTIAQRPRRKWSSEERKVVKCF